MENNTNGTTISEIVEKNYGLIKKLELISILIFMIGFICYELMIPDTKIIFILGVVFSAISLFLQAFKMIEFEDYESFNVLGSIPFVNFNYKLYYFGLSVSIMSLLGFVIEFQKGNVMLVAGGGTILAVLLFALFAKIQNKSRVYDLKFYLRIVICIAFLVYLALDKGIVK